MTKLSRVYRIETLIRERGLVSFQALLEELEVSPATLKRDLEYLRSRLGSPIEYDRHLNGYKFAAPSRGRRHELPGLWFSEQELYSLLMAHQLLQGLDAGGVVSRHLRPLLDRIHEMLGAREEDARKLLRRVSIVTPARRPVSTRHFEMIGGALTSRHRLHIRYLTRSRGEVTEREISPQRLIHYRNTWYLDAWCHERDRLLRFALDAIEQANTLDSRAKDVPMKQVEAEMDGGYGIYAGARRHWATLAFREQAARWVSHEQWHPEQKGRWLPDGSYELQVPYADETEIVMDVLRHGDQVQVQRPVELAQRVAGKLRAAAERYDSLQPG